MKNNNIFKLFLIGITAFLLRNWNLYKPEGLWNDEYVSWYIASQKDLWIFFSDMVKNCHTPLYYLYLKLWMFLFPDTDTVLRYSSVLPSVISVFVMYLVGKEVKNEKLGFLCSIVTAISSFLIYFAQEVRLYSLLFLITSVSVLYAIKVMKKPSRKNMIPLFISCMLIVLTHTLGIIYVFLLLVFVGFYLLSSLTKERRELILKKLLLFVVFPVCLIIIITAPFLYNIATYNSLSQFWSGFSYSKILLTFTDYYSPIQANIINSPDTFSSFIIQKDKINYVFIFFGISPTLIGIYGIINALLTRNKKITFLFLSAFIFFIYLVLISYTGKMVLITKYSVELYPVLILTSCFGLYKINDKQLRIFLITLFIGLNLFYLLTAADSAPKRTRPEGNLAVVELLRNSRLKQNDYVLLTYYDKDKFDRYLTDSDKYRFHSINKFNFNYFLYNNPNYKQVINKGKYLYKKDFEKNPNENIINFSKNTFQNNMKKGDRIGLVFLDNVSFMSNENIKQILNDKEQYKKTPYIFIVFSVIRNSMLSSFKENYRIDSITRAGDWTLIVYVKIKD